MENSFGKLVLLSDDAPEQEYELGKSRVTLGRATTNDIILSDARLSRNHARLECSPAGCTLVDQGSSNGSYVNEQRVERMPLQPGDQISLGSCQFRFERSRSIEEVGMTVIDGEADLDKALEEEVLPFAINETSQPRLVVVTPQRTWEVPLARSILSASGAPTKTSSSWSIPRSRAITPRCSAKATVFVLRDLGSTNGTWQAEARVDQLILQDGDEFRIGDATIVFKSGFEEESLTMADTVCPKVRPGGL